MLFIFILCILQPVLTSKESGCGCNLNRGKDGSVDKAKLLDSNDLEQCSFEDENKASKYLASEQMNTFDEMVLVPAGEYQVGTDDIAIESDQEGPKRIVKLESFYLDKYEVSNKNYAHFISETNYKTEAEQFGDSFVFSAFLNNTFKEQLKDFRAVQAMWWYKVLGADWKHPHGPDSDIQGTAIILYFLNYDTKQLLGSYIFFPILYVRRLAYYFFLFDGTTCFLC